ncbi:MAG: SLBB domain-containing protein, partial [Gaiellaceae bacterium]
MDVSLPSLTLRRLVAAGIAVAIVLVLAVRHFAGGGSVVPSVVPLQPSKATAAKPKPLVVDVAGAVRRPGLYRLQEGTRIADALAAAGGATAKAATDLVNLAAPLADGEQVVVP